MPSFDFPLIGWFAFEYLTEWPDWFGWVLLGWLSVVGASFGSFMNVVVYRLPAGLSIVRPGSRCPRCLHPIRGFDNVPVLSWLILRGRCRDCAAPISARYPCVEAAAAAITVLIALAELFPLDGLPSTWQPQGREPLDGAAAWIGFAFHVFLILTMMCGALIEFDGHVPPVRLFFPAFLVGLVVAIAYPETGNFFPLGPQRDLPVGMTGIVAGLFGAGVGSFVGRFLPANPDSTSRRMGLALVLATAGFAWGPSVTLAAAGAFAGALVLARASARTIRGKVPPLGAAALVAIALTIAARWYAE